MNQIEGNQAAVSLRRGHKIDRKDYYLYLFAAFFILYALFQILLFRFGRDQGIYSVVADSILRGGMPYKSAWDFKPPGIYIIYTFARFIFGSNEWGIRALEVIGLASMVPLFVGISKKLYGQKMIGLIGSAIAILVYAQLDFWHTGQPESFGGILTIYGLFLLLFFQTDRKPHSMASGKLFCAGLMFGLAGLMKPHLAGAAIPAVLWIFWSNKTMKVSLKARLVGVINLLGGTAIPIIICFVWFLIKGALSDMIQALFVFAPHYASLTWNWKVLPAYYYQSFIGFAMKGSALLFLGLFLAELIKPLSNRIRRHHLLIWGIIFIQLLGIAVQSKFFAYHFAATYPLGALMAGWGLWKLWNAAKRKGSIAILVFFLGIFILGQVSTGLVNLPESFWARSQKRINRLLMNDPLKKDLTDESLYNLADVNYVANVKVAKWLEQETTPSDYVFIWGFEPFIYQAAHRQPASRYIYNVPQRTQWARTVSRNELMIDLNTTEPAVIIVEHTDMFPWVTGNRYDSASTLKEFPILSNFIADNYVFKLRIEDFDIYVRRTQDLSATMD